MLEDRPYRYAAAGALMFVCPLLAFAQAPQPFVAAWFVAWAVMLLDLTLLAAFGRGLFPNDVTDD